MALRQLYSAESTCSLVSLSTWSWNILTWSMKDTTRSADIGEEWKPAAASSGAMWSGRDDWAAFRTKSSLQLSLSSATCVLAGEGGLVTPSSNGSLFENYEPTWSDTGSSGK